jgi:hypothetical protein
MAYIEASLQREGTVDLDSISTNRIITNFKPVGEAISKNCNQRKHPGPNDRREAHHQLTHSRETGQIDTFLEELRFFIQMSEEEQMFQMTPHLPTVEEYSRRRKGSSAVRVCLAITEYVYAPLLVKMGKLGGLATDTFARYAFGIELPEEVMNDEAMHVIWDETNVIIST